jgi:hypothetical protein
MIVNLTYLNSRFTSGGHGNPGLFNRFIAEVAVISGYFEKQSGLDMQCRSKPLCFAIYF